MGFSGELAGKDCYKNGIEMFIYPLGALVMSFLLLYFLLVNKYRIYIVVNLHRCRDIDICSLKFTSNSRANMITT
jgi:hypothetical protein